MTVKEAIAVINSVKFILDNEHYSDDVENALDMAIEALKAQEEKRTEAHSCDCISREATKHLDLFTKTYCRDKISYAVICDKFPSPHVYFNTYDEAEHWARFNQPDYRPFYIVKRSENFEIVGEVR